MRRKKVDDIGRVDRHDHLRAVVKLSLAISTLATSFTIATHMLGFGVGWSGLGMSCAVTAAIGTFAFIYLASAPGQEASQIARPGAEQNS